MEHGVPVGSLRYLLQLRSGGHTMTLLAAGVGVGALLLVGGGTLVVVLLLRARRLQQEAAATTLRRGPPGWCSTDTAVWAPSVSAPSTSSRRPSIITLTADSVGLDLNRSFPGSPRGPHSRHGAVSMSGSSPRASAGVKAGRVTPETDGVPSIGRSRNSAVSSTQLQHMSGGGEGSRCSPARGSEAASTSANSPRCSRGSQRVGSRSTAGSPTSSKRSTREGPALETGWGGGTPASGDGRVG